MSSLLPRRGRVTFEEIASLVGRDDPIILEIGANDGSDSRRFLDAFSNCRLFCFEPDSRAVLKWRRSIRDERAKLAPLAVGAVDGTVTFHPSAGRGERPADWDQSGSIRAPKNHLKLHSVTFPTTVNVACTRLDTWLASEHIDRIDFIWADVQGAEGDLVAGASRTLAMTRYFYTEYSDNELYEGQINLSTLARMLPDFEMAMLFRSDVLFKSTKL